ncbi:enoyl-CoA hydratase/isomerase family protein [Rhizorhabdus dicambivorans]|uniref:Enoyl-CoA hydratase n=1 Tax=Rhizorhabdus dicambivorans TaxID=1850238 RepID=A0A2A4FRW4_9SPHN|nr:enoyl-CoA hydratase-related protein [Rhizorhabdus dicambivorans]ATE63988.1 enoyl-CoA hydratase [Rhizorhabdus dicambivorans]PCE40188.1 enoyl-CoA hydratase [Rhizorhabdus dicambivorans]
MSVLLFERDGDVARLTLNRPDAANALDLTLCEALFEAATECDGDASIRCVVLTGTGRMFCAGGDIGAMSAAGDKVGPIVGELASKLHLAMSRLARMNKPLVTLVNGPAAGAGYGLALSGDVVLAARSAVFSAAYGALGVSPDGGLTWLLPRLVGLRRAQEIIISNRRLSAEEAETMGLITRAIDDEALISEGMAVAGKLAAGATSAIGRTRDLLLASFGNSWETHLELEARGIATSISSVEGKEGVAAFLGKRKPDFRGAQ